MKNALDDLKPVLLWTNPNPTANFAAQTVSIPGLSSYEFLLIEYKLSNNNDEYTDRIRIGHTGRLFSFGWQDASGSVPVFYSRKYTTTTSGVKFERGLSKSANSTAAGSSSNNVNIPLFIYGIGGA